ncbi:hypothetical protein OAA06_02205, partial [bacterium]|nr:hypothetical protein [bacterium]
MIKLISAKTSIALKKLGLLALFFCVILINVNANAFHVKTTGKASGNGTITNAWDLQTALNHPSLIKSGDTVYIHEGTYTGHFKSELSGSISNNIVITNYLNDRVIVDGNLGIIGENNNALEISGEYLTAQNFEITCSSIERITTSTSATPPDMSRVNGINIIGDNITIKNLHIHDNPGIGVSAFSEAHNTEIRACIINNNGWHNPDRPGGHNLYMQNEIGTKKIIGNFVFNSFGQGINLYSSQGSLKGFDIKDNILFNNGSLEDGDYYQSNFSI